LAPAKCGLAGGPDNSWLEIPGIAEGQCSIMNHIPGEFRDAPSTEVLVLELPTIRAFVKSLQTSAMALACEDLSQHRQAVSERCCCCPKIPATREWVGQLVPGSNPCLSVSVMLMERVQWMYSMFSGVGRQRSGASWASC
jgi:hypothetical protein